jgi:hypothetical protein
MAGGYTSLFQDVDLSPQTKFTDDQKEALRSGIMHSKTLFVMTVADLEILIDDWGDSYTNPVAWHTDENSDYVCIDGNHRLFWYKKLDFEDAQCIVLRARDSDNNLMSHRCFIQLCQTENLLHTSGSVHINDLERLQHIISILPQIVVPGKGRGGFSVDYDKLFENYNSDILGQELKMNTAKSLVTIARHLQKRELSRAVLKAWLMNDVHPVCYVFSI